MSLSIEALNQIVNNHKRLLPQPLQSLDNLTLEEATTFFQREATFWKDSGLNDLYQLYQQVLNALSTLERYSDHHEANRHLASALERFSQSRNRGFLSESPEAEFLARLQRANSAAVPSALTFITGYDQERLATPHQIAGAVAAALFRNPSFVSSALDARIDSFDRKQAQIENFQQDLASNYEAFKATLDAWQQSIQNDVDKLMEAERQSLQSTNAEWTGKLSETHGTWTSRLETANKELGDIKSTYDEHMSLRAPAEQWQVLHQDYSKQGKRWVWVVVGLVIAFVAATAAFLYHAPELFAGEKATLGGIKGAIVLGVAISMVVYLINLLAKIATSSYHLARDARERYQLTRVFLALAKEGVLHPKDRDVILGALFSRADTGLLKDAAPTITTPLGAIIDNFRPKS